MLVTLPEHDLATLYSSKWSKEVIDVAERNGIHVTSIEGSNVTRNRVERAITSNKPMFLMFNGHGSDSMIAGHDFEPIIILGDNDNLLKDKIVHAFTCSSGRTLGARCGASAFIGYSNWFIMCIDGNSTNRPLEDRLASPIMQCAMEAPKQLAKKKTAREAYEQSQAKYQRWIDEFTLSSSKYTTEELQLILPCLMWNKTCQVLYEDNDAKLN